MVLRGSTDSILDDLERAVDDGVNTYKVTCMHIVCSPNDYQSSYMMLISCYALCFQAMCKDSRTVPGAAATEIELARRLKEFSFKETG